MKNNILQAAEDAIGKRRIYTNTQSQKKTPWFTGDMKDLAKTKIEAYIEYKQSKSRQDYDSYKLTRNRMNAER